MTARRVTLCLGLYAAMTAASVAQVQVLFPAPGMPDVRRGEHVTLRLTRPAADPVIVIITPDGKKDDAHPITPSVAGDELSFVVDRSVPPGRYMVFLASGGKEVPVPGELRVLPDTAAPVEIESIYPTTIYPEGAGIEIVGVNLARRATDNVIDFVGAPAIPFGDAAECEASQRSGRYEKLCIEPVAGFEGRRIRVMGLSAKQYGPLGIRLRVGDGPWSRTERVTFAASSVPRIRGWSLVVLLAVGGGVYWLARIAARTQRSGRTGYNWLSVLLLDKDTDTYSLSKFQLLVWTAAFVFSYSYLCLCRSLVQWTFEWPDVPQRMPEMLGLSAGATVVAAGITAVKGSKGAGGIHPSAADFITSGGVVVGERLQYFIWTLVGAFVFVYLVFRFDPAQFQKLPDIPEGFLYLMGFSSAAYLGGKVARKPGPVVKNVAVESVSDPPAGTPPNMSLVVQGENLHEQATFQVDREQLRAGSVIVQSKVPANPVDGFCSELKLLLKEAAKWVEGSHVLTVANPDGQSADVAFPVSPMTITSVSPVRAGTTPVAVTVKGSNLASAIGAAWKEAAGAVTPATVQAVSDTELRVNLTPGAQKGPAHLTLKSPIGLKTGVDVNVS